jgi:hypothetical protein
MAASVQFTRLSQGIDLFGAPILGAIPQSNYIDCFVFSGAGSQTDNIPSYTDANGVTWTPNFVVIGMSVNSTPLYFLFGSSCAVPGSSVANGSSPEVNPVIRQIPKGTTQLSVAVGAACVVTLSYFL